MGCYYDRDKETQPLPSAGKGIRKHHEVKDPSAKPEQKTKIALQKSLTVPSKENGVSASPSSSKHRKEEKKAIARLKTFRVTSEAVKDLSRENKSEGILKLTEISATHKHCWVQSYGVGVSDRKAKKALQQHAASLRDLDHQNVLRVLDITQDDQHLNVLYEVTEGGSVQDLTDRSQGVSEKWAAGVMRQIFAAVRHCHSKGLVVKSLCPKSTLFAESPTEEFSWVKVLVPLEASEDHFTEYTAPEVKNDSYTGPQNDMYSCGMILSHLLVGKAKPTSIQGTKASEGMTTSFHKWNSVSQEAKDLILVLLSRNYRKRPDAETCLRNPWLSKFQTQSQLTPTLRAALRSMSTVSPLIPLKRILLQLIANLVVPYEAFRDIEKAFLELDTDMTGTVSAGEVKAQIYRLLPEEKANAAFTAIASALFVEEQTLSFSGFVLSVGSQSYLTRTNLTAAFNILDTEHTGHLGMMQFRKILDVQQDDTQAWSSLISSINSNSGSDVSYQEFCSFLKN